MKKLWIFVLLAGPAHSQVLQINDDGSARLVEPQSHPNAYARVLQAAASKYELSPLLLDAVAREESAYDPRALSPTGAIGIMQLMPATARELNVDPWDPVQNIFGGAAYLRQQIDRFAGNLELALAAYNAGSGRILRFKGLPPYAQTRRYVARNLDRLASQSLASTSGVTP